VISAKLTKSEAGNWWDENSGMIVEDLALYLDALPEGASITVEVDDYAEPIDDEEAAEAEEAEAKKKADKPKKKPHAPDDGAPEPPDRGMPVPRGRS